MGALADLLRTKGIAWTGGHELGSQSDVVSLIAAGLGIGFLPQSALCDGALRALPIEGLDLARKVVLYGVAGRQRSPAAEAFLKLARARDWLGEARAGSAARSSPRAP
jgi:DNA-binding transcriptional LysR family regulator